MIQSTMKFIYNEEKVSFMRNEKENMEWNFNTFMIYYR